MNTINAAMLFVNDISLTFVPNGPIDNETLLA